MCVFSLFDKCETFISEPQKASPWRSYKMDNVYPFVDFHLGHILQFFKDFNPFLENEVSSNVWLMTSS